VQSLADAADGHSLDDAMATLEREITRLEDAIDALAPAKPPQPT
jgi:hypothetical protein